MVASQLWHWFALKGDEPRPLFAFAGLYNRLLAQYDALENQWAVGSMRRCGIKI
jgi:hypothetical protein